MADRTQYDQSDPRQHTVRLKDILTDVVQHAREDVAKIDEPKAKALIEPRRRSAPGWSGHANTTKASPSRPGSARHRRHRAAQ